GYGGTKRSSGGRHIRWLTIRRTVQPHSIRRIVHLCCGGLFHRLANTTENLAQRITRARCHAALNALFRVPYSLRIIALPRKRGQESPKALG
ncbi:MAG TPA: hypothetical protein DDX54_06815, partial [Rhodospirillaceae bacterium]|nr:hypothetical protein [Rhodospirillaceae bacterium]